jgi:hypothetical protein
MKTLMNIREDFQAMMTLIDEMCIHDDFGSEYDALLSNWFAEIGRDEAVKLDGYVSLIQEFRARAVVSESTADAFRQQATKYESKAKWLESRLKSYLESMGRTSVRTSSGWEPTIQGNGGKQPLSVNPMIGVSIPLEALPEQFIRRKVVETVSLNTEEIRRLLEDGEVVEFEHATEDAGVTYFQTVEVATLLPRGTRLVIKPVWAKKGKK